MKNKANELASALLEKAHGPHESFQESFEKTAPALMSGFRGMFGEVVLEQQETVAIEAILSQYAIEVDIQEDKEQLFRITAEIKAINNQSVLLHGERIKRAQTVLKKYRDGAFSAWLVATYGNRQTPYSMLQYYELYSVLAFGERTMMEKLPKKAAYALAAREGSVEQKTAFLRTCPVAPQKELLLQVRRAFPKNPTDRRVQPEERVWLRHLSALVPHFEACGLSSAGKEVLQALVLRLEKLCR